MKIFTLLILGAASLQAANYSVNVASFDGQTPSEDIAFVDQGNPLALGTGAIAVGYFNSGFDPSGATQADIISNFNQFESVFSFTNFSDGQDPEFPGIFDGGTSSSNGIDPAFLNQPLTVLIADATDFASSTRFAALEHNTITFDLPDVNLDHNVAGVFNTVNSTVLLGDTSFLSTPGESGVDINGTTFSSVTLVNAIPEPSSGVMFLGLSIACAVRRRRQ